MHGHLHTSPVLFHQGCPQGHPSTPGVGQPQLPVLGSHLPMFGVAMPPLPPAAPQVTPYLGRCLFRRLWLPTGWAVCSRRAVAPRTVFPGIPNIAPKGFLGKLDPEGTATRAGGQPPCPHCWLMGDAAATSLLSP